MTSLCDDAVVVICMCIPLWVFYTRDMSRDSTSGTCSCTASSSCIGEYCIPGHSRANHNYRNQSSSCYTPFPQSLASLFACHNHSNWVTYSGRPSPFFWVSCRVFLTFWVLRRWVFGPCAPWWVWPGGSASTSPWCGRQCPGSLGASSSRSSWCRNPTPHDTCTACLACLADSEKEEKLDVIMKMIKMEIYLVFVLWIYPLF